MKLNDKQRKLVEDNHSLIFWYAHKNHLDLEEWYGILALALCKAALKYDEEKSKFTTYAVMSMKNEMLAELRKRKADKRMLYSEVLTGDMLETQAVTKGDLDSLVMLKDILQNDPRGELLGLYINGYTQAEIAEILGISQAHVSRIITSLRRELFGDR